MAPRYVPVLASQYESGNIHEGVYGRGIVITNQKDGWANLVKKVVEQHIREG
jgi:hypothetical protein